MLVDDIVHLSVEDLSRPIPLLLTRFDLYYFARLTSRVVLKSTIEYYV